MVDYVCTTEDFVVIEAIMSAPRNTKFMDIGDALLSNDDLKCLNSDDGFLPDDVSQQNHYCLKFECILSTCILFVQLQVVNAYIYCMRACDHLLDRADGKVYMDKTFISNQLKNDLKVHRHIIEHSYIYLKYDMVSINSYICISFIIF